jgi:hypothetical protein
MLEILDVAQMMSSVAKAMLHDFPCIMVFAGASKDNTFTVTAAINANCGFDTLLSRP